MPQAGPVTRAIVLVLAMYAAFVGGLVTTYYVVLGQVSAVGPAIRAEVGSIQPLLRFASTRGTQQRDEYRNRLVGRIDDRARAELGPEADVAAIYDEIRTRRPRPGHIGDALHALDALPAIVEAVSGRAEVLVDGGVRRGTDVLKALALGARAVLVGRPILWGLALGGEDGVRHVLELLRAELSLDLMLCGLSSPAEIDRSLLVPADRVMTR